MTEALGGQEVRQVLWFALYFVGGLACAVMAGIPIVLVVEKYFDALPPPKPLQLSEWKWLAKLEGFMDTMLGAPRRFTIAPHEETEWGTLFAIRDPDGKIVGLDRYTVAKQRCAELNSSETR